MKLLSILLLALFCSVCFGQQVIPFGHGGFRIDFEDLSDTNYVLIDSINQWYIGQPEKDKLALPVNHGNNCIYSDTSLFYGNNLVSSFQFKLKIEVIDFYCLQFFAKYDFESNKDGGTIETSWDNGISWQNLMFDAKLQDYRMGEWYFFTENDTITSLNNQPGFTGSTNKMNSYEFCWWLNPNIVEDTLLLRFTFSSDSILSEHEGWILDDFIFAGGTTPIYEIEQDKDLTLYPCPSDDYVFFKNNHPKISRIKIYSVNGTLLQEIELDNNQRVNVSRLNPGIYIFQCFTEDSTQYIKKFNRL